MKGPKKKLFFYKLKIITNSGQNIYSESIEIEKFLKKLVTHSKCNYELSIDALRYFDPKRDA